MPENRKSKSSTGSSTPSENMNTRCDNITSSVETGSASNVDASASIVPGTRGSSAFDCAKAPWPGMAG